MEPIKCKRCESTFVQTITQAVNGIRYCKDCRRLRSREWRDNNREKARKYARDRRAKLREKLESQEYEPATLEVGLGTPRQTSRNLPTVETFDFD